jgi:hypothetical protein
MAEFFSSLPFELGFPCPHKEIKHYINETAFKTWREGFNVYLRFGLTTSESKFFEKPVKYFGSQQNSTHQASHIGPDIDTNISVHSKSEDVESTDDDEPNNNNPSDEDASDEDIDFVSTSNLNSSKNPEMPLKSQNNDYKGLY